MADEPIASFVAPGETVDISALPVVIEAVDSATFSQVAIWNSENSSEPLAALLCTCLLALLVMSRVAYRGAISQALRLNED